MLVATPGERRTSELTPWIRLRWLMAVLPALLWVAGSVGWMQQGPGLVLWGATAIGVGTNIWISGRLRGLTDPYLTAVLLLDVVVLTAVLASTGGPENPLSSLYLFPVILAGLLLRARNAWLTLFATAIGYGSLFGLATADPHAGHGTDMRQHLFGMFLAYAVTGPMMLYAIVRVRALLAEAVQREREAEAIRTSTERLSSLATLAAGAAHELATPLSTILVVARELERRAVDADTHDDAVLVGEEVQRCKDILQQLAADAGAGMGESRRSIGLRELVEGAGDKRAVIVASDDIVEVPVRLIQQALRRMLGNAWAASAPNSEVRVTAEVLDDRVVLCVEDAGHGMSPEVAARATEPFFTTRPVGQGTGLGLFFVHSVATHLGGGVGIDSQVGVGTRVTMWVPRREQSNG